MSLLSILQCVRNEIEKHWVPLVLDERESNRNYSGTGEGCCVDGAIYRCNKNYVITSYEIHEVLDAAAIELHPELEGKVFKRIDAVPAGIDRNTLNYHDENGTDNFDSSPRVVVNNHLGKTATLLMVKTAIEAEEAKLAG